MLNYPALTKATERKIPRRTVKGFSRYFSVYIAVHSTIKPPLSTIMVENQRRLQYGKFIEEFYYGNIDPQARSTKQNKAVQKQMEVLMLNEEFLTKKLWQYLPTK